MIFYTTRNILKHSKGTALGHIPSETLPCLVVLSFTWHAHNVQYIYIYSLNQVTSHIPQCDMVDFKHSIPPYLHFGPIVPLGKMKFQTCVNQNVG